VLNIQSHGIRPSIDKDKKLFLGLISVRGINGLLGVIRLAKKRVYSRPFLRELSRDFCACPSVTRPERKDLSCHMDCFLKEIR
jgi:hypothetical protein